MSLSQPRNLYFWLKASRKLLQPIMVCANRRPGKQRNFSFRILFAFHQIDWKNRAQSFSLCFTFDHEVKLYYISDKRNLFFHTFRCQRFIDWWQIVCKLSKGKKNLTINLCGKWKRNSFLIAFFLLYTKRNYFSCARLLNTVNIFLYFFICNAGNSLIYPPLQWDDFKNILSPFEKREIEEKTVSQTHFFDRILNYVLISNCFGLCFTQLTQYLILDSNTS